MARVDTGQDDVYRVLEEESKSIVFKSAKTLISKYLQLKFSFTPTHKAAHRLYIDSFRELSFIACRPTQAFPVSLPCGRIFVLCY